MKTKVLAAMSGGVDSSVAAYLLKEEGYEVIGVTMKLFCYGESASSPKSCCSLDSINDAKAVCDNLGIPHYVLSYEKEFESEVIRDFVSEYEKGRTPNPCVRCNQLIKFSYLLDKAKQLGCTHVATGHYARISDGKLLRGVDKKKDQTYFLYRLNEEQLSHLKFPLGELTKKKVREIARNIGLKTAEKPESQEICFIDTNIQDFLKDKIKPLKGDILDKKGNKLGEHEGVAYYTIGQRKGLGGGFKKPMYVTGINVKDNTITVGEEKDLYTKEVLFEDSAWISGDLPYNKGLTAMVRYNMEDVEVESVKINSKYKTIFKEPVRAVTPGQSIVFYSGEECLGGGIISN